MHLQDFLAQLDALASKAPPRIAAAADLEAWTEVRNDLIGRTSGELTHILGHLGALPKEDRREAGQRANAVWSNSWNSSSCRPCPSSALSTSEMG